MLQQHGSLKTIKKKLIRKALDMIRRIADEDPDESDEKAKTGSIFNHIYYLCNSYSLFMYGCLHALLSLLSFDGK